MVDEIKESRLLRQRLAEKNQELAIKSQELTTALFGWIKCHFITPLYRSIRNPCPH
jgi:hypothetical protein